MEGLYHEFRSNLFRDRVGYTVYCVIHFLMLIVDLLFFVHHKILPALLAVRFGTLLLWIFFLALTFSKFSAWRRTMTMSFLALYGITFVLIGVLIERGTTESPEFNDYAMFYFHCTLFAGAQGPYVFDLDFVESILVVLFVWGSGLIIMSVTCGSYCTSVLFLRHWMAPLIICYCGFFYLREPSKKR
jgi:hypothetical protein